MALQAVNRQVYGSSLASRYATLFYGVVDEATRTLHYVNAGHNPPMVIRPDGSTIWLTTGGAPVGLFPDSIYEEGSVQLGSGDLILTYTDGVIESLSPSHWEWGTEGLRIAATESDATSADDMVEAIMQSMDKFSHAHQTDDATAQSYLSDPTGAPFYAGNANINGYNYTVAASSFSTKSDI